MAKKKEEETQKKAKYEQEQLSEILESTHSDYDTWLPRWEKTQDVTDGEDSVKDKGETYLPKTELMSTVNNGQELYDAYKERANFFNGTGRTVDGLVGLAFRKDPTISIPTDMESFRKDFNMHNQSLENFSKSYLEQIIIKNRVGLLIDYPTKMEEMSASETNEKNFRPFAVKYDAESIMDWDEERINNVYQTTYVMLKENERKRSDMTVTNIEKRRILDLAPDEGEMEREKERLRSLYAKDPDRLAAEISLMESHAIRYYRQRVFEKIETEEINQKRKEDQWIMTAEFFPTDSKGNRFTEIPFFSTTDRGISWKLNYSMIYDLASVNLSLYRNSADLENINHITTNPTPCVSGLVSRQLNNPNLEESPGSEQEMVPLGSNVMLEFETDGKWGMLEASGAGAQSMENMMAGKKREMALLGSRILAEDPKGIEAAETAEIHRAGEQGVLSSAVDAMSETMLRALSFMWKWQNGSESVPDDIEVNYNKDYLTSRLEAGVVATALQAVQSGEMSSGEFFVMLQKGEWISGKQTYEDHLKEVEEDKSRKGDEFETLNVPE